MRECKKKWIMEFVDVSHPIRNKGKLEPLSQGLPNWKKRIHFSRILNPCSLLPALSLCPPVHLPCNSTSKHSISMDTYKKYCMTLISLEGQDSVNFIINRPSGWDSEQPVVLQRISISLRDSRKGIIGGEN